MTVTKRPVVFPFLLAAFPIVRLAAQNAAGGGAGGARWRRWRSPWGDGLALWLAGAVGVRRTATGRG